MKMLVVVDQRHQSQLADSLLLRKAATLANGMGASLELLRVVYDRTIEVSTFLKAEALPLARQRALAEQEAWVAQIAESLQRQGLSVRYDVRWDKPRAEAILRKAAEDDFDWIVKEPSGDRHLLGLFSNVDWEVLRSSPVPAYFVKGAIPPGAGVLIALDGLVDAESSNQGLDYEVYRQGREICEMFDTPLTVVHAYEVPTGVAGYLSYAPTIAEISAAPMVLATLSEAEQRERQQVAERHGQAIRGFAAHFDFPVSDIVLREGPPQLVISDEAHRRQVGLVVMAAGEATAFDRLFRKTSAEPTLAESHCDILFVKRSPPPVPAARDHADKIQSVRSDSNDSQKFANTLTDPSARFKRPDSVINARRLTPYQKRRILRAWQRAETKQRSETSLSQKTTAQQLDGIRRALRKLRHQS